MPLPEQNSRGVKRKRPHGKESEEDKAAKLRRKLHHALRELRKVVKKARTFEVQKTLKKLNDARRKDPESDLTKDLVAQMEILKHLNYDQLAHSALLSKLKKDKALFMDRTIQTISVELSSNLVSPAAPRTPTAKVQSRILSSKVLASEVVSTVEALRMFTDHPVGAEGIGIREATDASRASPDLSKKRRTRFGHDQDALPTKDNVTDLSERSDGGFENTSGDEAVAEVAGGWESGTVGQPFASDDSMVGAVDDHDTSSEDSEEVGFPSEDAKSKTTRSQGFKSQSEFFPSLSVGFTRGDSSSEFSDSETKFIDRIKKNRRGQRARRAIWEKKFGKNANHVKKRQQQDTEHRQPGSVPIDRRSGKRNSFLHSHRTPMRSRAPEQSRRPAPKRPEGAKNLGSTKGQSERKDGPRGKEVERPLHPSWEAKRKLKSASIVASQGTKIVFFES